MFSENCGSTLETWKDGYIFGDSEWGFCFDNSECDTYLGGSTGMCLYLGNLESWFYFGDSKMFSNVEYGIEFEALTQDR